MPKPEIKLGHTYAGRPGLQPRRVVWLTDSRVVYWDAHCGPLDLNDPYSGLYLPMCTVETFRSWIREDVTDDT